MKLCVLCRAVPRRDAPTGCGVRAPYQYKFLSGLGATVRAPPGGARCGSARFVSVIAAAAAATPSGDERNELSTGEPASFSVRPATGVSSWTTFQQEYGASDESSSTWIPAPPPPRLPGGRMAPVSDAAIMQEGPDWDMLNEAAADVARFRNQQARTAVRSRISVARKRRRRAWRQQLQDLPGWLLYRYYNWRQDGFSDLLLVTGASASFMLSAALIKRTFIDTLHGDDPDGMGLSGIAAAAAAAASGTGDGGGWLSALLGDLYSVMVLTFGENLAPPGSSPLEELFDVLVALAGLAGFALALALVEQVVLETNLANVKRGSTVYEEQHFLVLGWGVSQRDLEVLLKLVGQLICAAAADGGATIVVLTQREKLDMEELFRRSLPPSLRAGSRLVFRQGSPLLPSDLRRVAASSARATIILSDQSRGRDEADAQSLRCAILLDELDDYRGLRKGRAMGHIVVETRTHNAVPLLRFSCSRRVIALPTGLLNMHRVARMVKRPFISWVSQRLMAFDSRYSLFLQPAQDLVGRPFRSLAYLFPDAIVLGVAHVDTGRVTLNPGVDYVLGPSDELVLCRPTAVPTGSFSHLPELHSIPQLEAMGEQEAEAAAAAAAAGSGHRGKVAAARGWQAALTAAAASIAGMPHALRTGWLDHLKHQQSTVDVVLQQQQQPAGSADVSAGAAVAAASTNQGTQQRYAAAVLDNASPGSSTQSASPSSSPASSISDAPGRPPLLTSAAAPPAQTPPTPAPAPAPATAALLWQRAAAAAADASRIPPFAAAVDGSLEDGCSSSIDEGYGPGYAGVSYDGTDDPTPPAAANSSWTWRGGVMKSSADAASNVYYPIAGWSTLNSTLDSLDGHAVSGSASSNGLDISAHTMLNASLDDSGIQRWAEAGTNGSTAAVSNARAARGNTEAMGSRDEAHGTGPIGNTMMAAAALAGSIAAAAAAALPGATHDGGSVDAAGTLGEAGIAAGQQHSEMESHSMRSSFNYVPQEYLSADSSPEAVLVCGWATTGFMAELLWALSRGSAALPPGSEIVFANTHPPEETLGVLLRGSPLLGIKVSHVALDPLQRSQLAGLPLGRFRTAVVLADERWVDADGDESNGIDGVDQPSVLRQDSLMVMVQLNIRKLLDELALPPINIICQKVATQGLTRFEDRRRLPLGISVNFNSMSAKLLTQVATNPLSLLVITALGGDSDFTIVDASEYCARGEAISFWRVLSRAQAAGDVLVGFYVLPASIDTAIESTINPQGLAARSKPRVWNQGDGRLKFICIREQE